MSHVASRCKCKHICDYSTWELSSIALAPFLSYDALSSQQSKDVVDRRLDTGLNSKIPQTLRDFSFFSKVLRATNHLLSVHIYGVWNVYMVWQSGSGELMPASFLSVHNRQGTLLSVSFGLFHLIITSSQLSGYFILQRKKLRIRQMGHFSKALQQVTDADRIRVQAFRFQSLSFQLLCFFTALWPHGGGEEGRKKNQHLSQLKLSPGSIHYLSHSHLCSLFIKRLTKMAYRCTTSPAVPLSILVLDIPCILSSASFLPISGLHPSLDSVDKFLTSWRLELGLRNNFSTISRLLYGSTLYQPSLCYLTIHFCRGRIVNSTHCPPC